MNWFITCFYIHLYLFGIIGFYLLFSTAKWMTIFFLISIVVASFLGITMGAHRLYAHQAFTAVSEFRCFIVIAHTLAGVGSLQKWVFWHRVHHKFYGTERDPYNHKKGFFYSHVYSNFLWAPSDLDTYAKDIDMRDVEIDGYVWMQDRFYWIFFIVLTLLIPINIPVAYWNESLATSVLIMGATRLMITTNISWLVNSAMLLWGLKKGDKFPYDGNSIFFLWKSYWLNYHYMISWDWKNDEFGSYDKGFATLVIKICRELGLISEMMTVDSKKLQDVLYEVASTEKTMADALDTIKEEATIKAQQQKLMYYH